MIGTITVTEVRVEIRQLQYFVAVAECESVSAAARRLFVTQPALSRQIRQLEREAGQALFVRGAKGMELTDAGAGVLVQAQRALAAHRSVLGAANQAAHGLPFFGRCLRVATQCAGLAEMTPIVVALLQQRFPGLRVELQPLTFGELFRSADGGFDALVGLSGLFADRHDCSFTPIFTDPVVALVGLGHGAADAAYVDLAEVLEEPGVPLSGAPRTWAAPLLLADARNDEAPPYPKDMPMIWDFDGAVDAVMRFSLLAPSAATDRLIPAARKVARIPVRGAEPLVFGVYTFGDRSSHAAPDPLRFALRDAALDVAAAFLDLVPGAALATAASTGAA